jgi:hypothetical protein
MFLYPPNPNEPAPQRRTPIGVENMTQRDIDREAEYLLSNLDQDFGAIYLEFGDLDPAKRLQRAEITIKKTGRWVTQFVSSGFLELGHRISDIFDPNAPD